MLLTGSPFVVLVSGADAGKVRTHGPGIEHGVLSSFHGQFFVETAGAGPGQLTVKVRGPKGSAGDLSILLPEIFERLLFVYLFKW